ncbi:MAG: universal stress protein [Bacteroidia bacterium]
MNRLKHILCPVDFSEASYQAIEKASFFAQLFQADLTLLHVINVLPQSFGVVFGLDINSNNMVEKATENARTLLREAKKNYVPYAVTCKSSIRVGNHAEQILLEADEISADLIVLNLPEMASSDASGKASYTDHLVLHADCPVMTFRANKPDGIEARKGFRKILIPVNRNSPLAEIYRYLDQYLSFMAPEITLFSVLPPDASDLRKNDYKLFHQMTTKEWVGKGLGKITAVIQEGTDARQGIRQYALSHGYDLLLLYTNVREGHYAEDENGVANLVNHASVPVITLRTGKTTSSA